jgi:protease-4
VSLGDDASGVEVNPGGLGFLRGFELELFATSLDGGVPGDGQAFFVASPIFGPFSLGLGIQHIALQTLETTTATFSDYARLSLSAAMALGRSLSFGLTGHFQFGDAPGVSLSTLDLGLVWRPSRWFSFGAVVQDVTTPHLSSPGPVLPLALGPLELHRAWVTGIGLRPGTDRVFIGAEVRMQEGGHGVDARFDPAFRLLVEPIPGLALTGSIEARPRGDNNTEVLGQVGLTWRFDFSPVRGALSYSSYVENHGRGHEGFTVAGRLYGFRERALPQPTERFVKIRLKDAIPENASPDGGLLSLGSAPTWTLGQALRALDASRRDERVQGVLLAFDDVGLGLAQAEEIRAAVARLRAAGKRVIAHITGSSNAVYVAASAAERIYLHPLSGFNVVGFSSQIIFLRGLLDKVGVLPEFIAEGKYKSAPEQLERKSSSEPAKEARLAYLREAMAVLTQAIAKGRKKDPAAVRAIIDRAPLGAEDAVKEGVVDGIAYLDDLPKQLEKEGIRMRFLADPGAPAASRWGGYPQIAVIHVEGTIAEGKSTTDPIFRSRVAGAETIVAAIRQARFNPAVRAIVLRVNSPGGSGTASDRIWRELEETKAVKPVIASFGNLAASGGYYVAAGAKEIFADPATLTGSIGVFFGKFSLAGLFGKLDVTTEAISLGKHADITTLARPWTEEERVLLRQRVHEFYEKFLDRVARGRRMKRDEVHKVAQGRIWSGEAALRHKLVDRLAGLDEAIDRAKELAGLPKGALVGVQNYPQPSFFSRLVQRFRVDGEALPQAASDALRALASPLVHLRAGEPWAILPFEWPLR